MVLPPILAWICPVCGYIHYGSEPPDECPVCGTLKELFEPYEQPGIASSTPAEKEKVVIVGAGIAGVSAAESLHKTDPAAEIVLLSSDSILPYYRMNLTRYLAGEVKAEALPLHPEDWYKENGIDLRLNVELSSIDTIKKSVTSKSGEVIAFDKLILTTGAAPFVPPIPGADKKNVMTLRTKQDADMILKICQPGTNVVCIGGGILGLENAGGLARRGVHVTVLEDQPWLLSRQLNETAAAVFELYIKTLGITARTAVKTQELVGGESVEGALLNTGETLPADVVVISTGVRSNISMAKAAGLNVNQGIIVDDSMRTSHPDIFAAGDSAEHKGIVYGTWSPALAEGLTAGNTAGGGSVVFTGLPRSNLLKVLGIDMYSIGPTAPAEPLDMLVEERSNGYYTSFLFRGNHLIGSMLLGDASLSGKVKKAIEEKMDLSQLVGKKPDVTQVKEYLAGIEK